MKKILNSDVRYLNSEFTAPYLERRVEEHNSGKSRSTRNRRPFTLVFYEEFTTRLAAAKRERFLKSGAGHTFLRSVLP